MRSIPNRYSPASISLKYKDHDSPITRLTNLNQSKNEDKTKKDQILIDRSNQIFLPKNASKYINANQSYENTIRSNSQIEQIKKKYSQIQNQDKVINLNDQNQRNGLIKYDRYQTYTNQNKNKSHSNRQNIQTQKFQESIRTKQIQKIAYNDKEKIISPFKKYQQNSINSINFNKYQNSNPAKLTKSPIPPNSPDRNKSKSNYMYEGPSMRVNGFEITNQKNKQINQYQNKQLRNKQIYFANNMTLSTNQSYSRNIKKEQEVSSFLGNKNNKEQMYGNCEKVPQIKKVISFQQENRIKQFQNRMRQREQCFRKRQQELRQKYQKVNDVSTINKSAKVYTNNNNTNNINRKVSQFKYDNMKKDEASKNLSRQKSVHKIDSEIQKLELKIRQFENRKKQMNINYKPYDKYDKYDKQKQSINKINQHKQTQSNYNNQQEQDWRYNKNAEDKTDHQRIKLIEKERKIIEDMKKERKSTFIENTKPMYSQRTLPVNKIKQQPNQFAFQLFRIESEPQQSSKTSKVSICSTQKLSKVSSEYSQKNLLQCVNQMQIQKRADEGREERKKKLQEKSLPENTHILKKLVSLLSEQCLLDQEFRNNKIWFNSIQGDKKYKQVKKYLNQHPELKITLTEAQNGLFQQFKVCQDENNPFFSVNQPSKFSYQSLLKSFYYSNSHWKEKILGRFDKLDLMGESFNKQKLDLEKKGFINVQDLVRFLNIQSGNFYRNRDLFLIYQRFLSQIKNSNSNQLTFQQILNCLTF